MTRANRPAVITVLAATLGAFGAAAALAGDANYQNYIVGERAAGMGGAVVATAEGVGAVFFNPAGLADVEKNSISLSASLYGFQNEWRKSRIRPFQDLQTGSFVTIPTTFGSVYRLSENAAAAFGVFVPNSSRASSLQSRGHAFLFEDYFQYRLEDQTVWIGPALGGRLGERVSLGVALFGVYRSYSLFSEDFWQLLEWSLSQEIVYDNLSLLAVFGARFDLDDNWLLGLRLQTLNTRIAGSGNFLFKGSALFEYDEETGEADLVFTSRYLEDGKSRYRLPTKLTAGAAYRREDRFSLGADISFHLPVRFNRLEGFDQRGVFFSPAPLERKFTVDLNLGGEYYLAPNYPLRTGFFTSRSSAPEPDPAAPWNPPRIDKYGLTASAGRESEQTTFNLGLNYVWGSGGHLGYDSQLNSSRKKAKYSALYLFLSSSYLF